MTTRGPRKHWTLPPELRGAQTREELSELLREVRQLAKQAQLEDAHRRTLVKVENLIERQILQTPMSRREIDRVRWYHVVQTIDEGKPQTMSDGTVVISREGNPVALPDGAVIVWPMTVEEACEVVVEKLRGTPCEAAYDTIKRVYYEIQNDPDETWRRGYPGVIKRP